MMSVFKFPLALAILHLVDKRKLALNQKISIPKEKLDTNTWSPMVKDFPNREPYLSLSDLLIYAVAKGDNNACDFLYGLAGGTTAVNTYMHRLGIKDISIVYTEEAMSKTRSLQYKNWCKTSTMVQLLQFFYNRKLLSKQSNDWSLSMQWDRQELLLMT
jgi:beta-lactamase class A